MYGTWIQRSTTCVPKALRFGRSELSVRFGSDDSGTPNTAAHLDDDLVPDCLTMLFIFEPREFIEKLLKSDIRVYDDRFHLREVLEVWI